jgi:hypothetical protein
MSRQEILDDPIAAFPQLGQFLAAYFHQDWEPAREGWMPVVNEFITESPHSVVVATADEVRDLLAAGLTDGELGELLSELGASVRPEGFDMTPSAWLDAVLERLRSPR